MRAPTGLAWIAATILMASAVGAHAGEPIALVTAPVALSPQTPGGDSVGRLTFRGGIELRSEDERFGALSDLVVSADGQNLLAITDHGDWFAARLAYDSRGWLDGATEGHMGRLVDPEGKPLAGTRSRSDAESMALLPDGSIVVGFERRHRLWRYAPSEPPFARAPVAIEVPSGLATAPANEGLEAMAVLGDGRLLALTEGLVNMVGGVAAWLTEPGIGSARKPRWEPMTYALTGTFRPTAAAEAPSGDIVVLERRYNPLDGPSARLTLVPRVELRPGARVTGRELARLEAPMTVDNFEGVALRRVGAETLVYIVSDDNFRRTQRTLLLMFALSP